MARLKTERVAVPSVFEAASHTQELPMNKYTRAILPIALALAFLAAACAAPHKPSGPVGKPPAEDEKLMPKDPNKHEDTELPDERASVDTSDVPTR